MKVCVFLIAVVLLLQGPAGADELTNSVDRHIAWRGGPAFESLAAIEQQGKFETAGLEGSAHLRQLADGHQIFVYDLNVISGTEAMSPAGGWEISTSSQVENLGTTGEKTALRDIDLAFGLSLQGKGTGTLEHIGIENIEGISYEVVRVRFVDFSNVDYFLDPQDGSLTWLRSTSDSVTTWMQFSDWRMVDGVRMAFNETKTYPTPARNQVFTWQEITVNPELDPAIFARPEKPASMISFTDGASSTGWLPFDFFRNTRIFVNAGVNDHTVPMLVDSGASMTIIDKSLAAMIGLESLGEVAAKGAAGTDTLRLAAGVTIKIGNLALNDMTVGVMDFTPISKGIGRQLSVILGAEIFDGAIVDIDFPGRRFAIHSADSYEYDGFGIAVPIKKIRATGKQIAFSIEGLPTAYADLDTGADDTVSLFKPYTDEHGLLEGRRLSTGSMGGIGGSSEVLLGTVKQLSIAGVNLEDVPVTFHRDEEGSFATSEVAGNLGLGIMRRFRVTFDFSSSMLYFEPAADTVSAPFDKDRSGLQTRLKGDGLTVTYVARSSPAESGGWKIGDKITAINGTPIDADYWDRLYGWNFAPAGTSFTLQLENGEVRELILKDLY